MMRLKNIQVVLFAAFALSASAQCQAIPAARIAVSNFLAVMQSGTGFPRPIFAKATMSVTSNAIVVIAPGFQITFGNASINTNALVTHTWTSDIPNLLLVVQHLPHANVERITSPPIFRSNPIGPDSVQMEKAPIIFKRPTEKDVQVLLQCFADQGINLKLSRNRTSTRVSSERANTRSRRLTLSGQL